MGVEARNLVEWSFAYVSDRHNYVLVRLTTEANAFEPYVNYVG